MMWEIGSIGFKQAWVLLLLPALWSLIYYVQTRKAKPSGIFLPTISSLSGVHSAKTKLIRLLPWLRYAAFSLFIIALARPQKINKEEVINSSGIDISMVIDLSSSMLARDFRPNRLEVTKQLAQEFVKERPNDRISISIFAGNALGHCPLTSDHRMVLDILQGLEQGVLEDGTAIGMGLASGVNMLKDSKAKSKVIILLTDGVNTAGYIDPLTAAGLAEDYGIKVYVIGVGTNEGQAETPVSRTPSGQIIYGYVPVEIDEPLMTEIANLTNGQYFRATDEGSLQQIYNRINTLEKTKIEKAILKKGIDYFRVFLIIGLIFIFVEILLKNTWLRTPVLIE
jgi:Ca-activated chloride channel homolog